MLDQWLEKHKQEIAERYAAQRVEVGDPRPAEAIRSSMEDTVMLLVRAFRGDEGFDFLQTVKTASAHLLATGVPLDTFIEALSWLFLTIRQVMEQEQPPQLTEWLCDVSELLLQGSRGMIEALATDMEQSKVQIETLYRFSRSLSAARDENDVLQVAIQIAQGAEADAVTLLYVDLDQEGNPEWCEAVGSWHRQEQVPSIPAGTRYYLPEFPITDLWLSSQDKARLVADVTTDEQVDENTRQVLLMSGVHALLVIPLTQAAQWVGLLTFSWGEPRELEPQALETYNSLGGLVSPAVASLRLVRNLERMVEERTAESTRLQQKMIEAQQQALKELSTPIIPILDQILVMPLVGEIDSARARDIMRALLAAVRERRASVVILDITGVPIVDSGVAAHLNKTIRAAQLKGAQTIITGISEEVAEAIVDLGIDWGKIDTLSDLQTGLMAALEKVGRRIV